MPGVSQANLSKLQTSIRGRVIAPGEPRYDESRLIWNGMIDRRPSVVARCIGTEDDGEERIRAAYGDSYERLVEVKTKWDPGNVFSNNKNIAPRP